METTITDNKEYQLKYHGNGGDFFGITIINWLITALTLGFYYPWAKAKKLQYIYSSISLNNDRFAFHGTGKEMFKGFIKAVSLLTLIFIVFISLTFMGMPIIGIVFFYVALFAITPIAIHGSYRYRMSRTSWRGIRFGYRGDRNEFVKNFFKWTFLTIITIGFYGAWFAINVRNYVVGNIKFGNAEFKYKAKGYDYFILNLKGYFLTLITLGIYLFWWQKNIFAFYIDHLSIQKDDKTITLKSTATGGDFFKLMMVNLLILIFTFGLGYAWVFTRTMNFVFEKIKLDGDIDLDTLLQTEENYKNATGEDISDILDIDLV